MMGFSERKVVQGEVEVRHEGVNILANTQRIGHAERTAAMHHILDMKSRGYITDQEAEARLNAAQSAEKQAEVNALTADLPAPFVKTNLFQRYNWDKHWLPTLLSGMAGSLILAIVPPAVLGEEHLFPHTPAGLGIGMACLIVGFLCFFACVGGLVVKVD